ncbi:hypothetical protein ACHAXR_007506 [Thalassiosira sp. AJA248-18]
MTPEEELLDQTAHSILRQLLQESTSIHGDKTATELNADDSQGQKDGILWSPPTSSPTPSPTTGAPTSAPTGHPTPPGEIRILKGMMWYDRNANGVRDSNVKVEGVGDDVEWSHGVGGVGVQLVECDGETGREYIPGENEPINSYASTMVPGFDAIMHPQIVPLNDGNGQYKIVLPGLERFYYIQGTAPEGFLFTSGVCDTNAAPGSDWACNYDLAIDVPEEEEASRRYHNRRQRMLEQNAPDTVTAPGTTPKVLGIASGRSTQCVYVDKYGEVQAPINFGIMRVGDTKAVGANVALVLAFDEIDSSSVTTATSDRRSLKEVMHRATVLDEVDDGTTVTTRYLLQEEDKRAIATVTAEILAATLDSRLAEENIELDSVNPKGVILSDSRPSGNGGDSSQTQARELAVAMEIKGHYSPPPFIDFEYIVEDSINRDTSTIRRGLREYNSNCRDQTTKVEDQGLKKEDFNAVVSTYGAARPGRDAGRPVSNTDIGSMNNVFSTACNSDFLVPEYFETSLKEIEARNPADLKFKELEKVIYVTEESASRLDSWALGPVAGIAGLIVLLMGAFVFRRALGPRHADMYSDRKTKELEKELRCFGEAGGAMDDGSVDSAFYSDDEDDSDLEETEKERKMRRKRKEKGEEQDRGGKLSKSKSVRAKKKNASSSSNKNSRKRGDLAASMSSKNSSSSNKDHKLAVSHGSDDTDSVGKFSNSSDEVDTKSRERKRSAAKERSDKKSSSSSSSKRRGDNSEHKGSSSSRKGRSKRSGGDNAKAARDDSRIV